jgi:hypothetical protein
MKLISLSFLDVYDLDSDTAFKRRVMEHDNFFLYAVKYYTVKVIVEFQYNICKIDFYGTNTRIKIK